MMKTNRYHHHPFYDSLTRKTILQHRRGVWKSRKTERVIPNIALGIEPIMQQFGLDTALSSRANAPVQTQLQQPSILHRSP